MDFIYVLIRLFLKRLIIKVLDFRVERLNFERNDVWLKLRSYIYLYIFLYIRVLVICLGIEIKEY